MKDIDIAHLELLEPSYYSIDHTAVFYNDGGRLYKVSPAYDVEWRSKVESAMRYVHFHSFSGFINDSSFEGVCGYHTLFRDGRDLWGDVPFKNTHKRREIELSTNARKSLVEELKKLAFTGMSSQYFFADWNRRNFIVLEDEVYFIDFGDIIAARDMDEGNIHVIQEMLDYLKIDHKFDGDLEKLFKALC